MASDGTSYPPTVLLGDDLLPLLVLATGIYSSIRG